MKMTSVFDKLALSKAPLTVSQGSSSSSKTWSHLQLFYLKAKKHDNKIFSIVSESLPHLKKGAMRDFFNMLKNEGIYSEKFHNKTEGYYEVNKSIIEFFSVDDSDKARGPRRDYLYINECDRIPFDTFMNLEMRTNIQTYIDYNPVREFWVHENIIGKDAYEYNYIHSTYKDNDQLNQKTIKSIEALQSIDANKWRVFGLGELGYSDAIIHKNIRTCKELPNSDNCAYGLDFGYNHPTALIKCVESDGVYYSDELLYESHLTNSQLIERLKILIPNRRKEIFADSARPEQIQEIKLAGFNIHQANKDVKKGIDSVQTKNPIVTERSLNLIKERKNYFWKSTKDGKILDEPVKILDDAVDAERYCIHSWTKADIKRMTPRGFGMKI